ncbi:MAG: hypothetical protein ACRDQA_27495, partial [Nocardioidaceae bacterium]
RLHRGACGSPSGAKRLVTDTLAIVAGLRSATAVGPVLLRAEVAEVPFPAFDSLKAPPWSTDKGAEVVRYVASRVRSRSMLPG